MLREAAKLLEYSSIWHPKDADGEAEADVIRLKVFKAIFPSKFATYFGLAPCLFWQNERRLIAIAFADLVAMQDRLDKSVPTRNGEQKRERKGLGFDRFNVGRASNTRSEPHQPLIPRDIFIYKLDYHGRVPHACRHPYRGVTHLGYRQCCAILHTHQYFFLKKQCRKLHRSTHHRF